MLEHFGQTWHDLGYPQIALCIQDFFSPDSVVREKAYDVLYDIDRPDSGLMCDNRYQVQSHLVKFLFCLFKESPYEKDQHLGTLVDMSGVAFHWTQDEKDEFEDLVASHIEYLEQFLDVPEWKYSILAIFGHLSRYRERLAPILLNFTDDLGIVPFSLSRLMVTPISNIDAYITYFEKHALSESEAIRKLSEETLVRLFDNRHR